MSSADSVGHLVGRYAAGSGAASDDLYKGPINEIHYSDVALLQRPSDQDIIANAPSPVTGGSKLRNKLAKATAAEATSGAAAGLAFKSAVLENLSLRDTLDEDLISKLESMCRRSGDCDQGTVDALHGLDDNFKYTTTVGFDTHRLCDEAQLEVTLDFLSRYGQPICCVDEHVYEEYLEDLAESLVPDPAAVTRLMKQEITRPFFPFGDHDLVDLIVSVNLFSHSDMMKVTLDKLAATDSAVAGLDAEIERLNAEQKEAVASENIKLAVQKADELLEFLERKIDLVLDRKRVVHSQGNASSSVKGRLDLLNSSTAIPTLVGEKDGLLRNIKHDLEALERDRTERVKIHEQTIQSYDQYLQHNYERVLQVRRHQEDIFGEMRVLADKLHKAVEKEKELVHQHIEAVQVEHKRRKEYAEYRDSYSWYRATLEELRQAQLGAKDFLMKAQQYVVSGAERIANSGVEERIEQLHNREFTRYTEATAAFGERCVEFRNRAERRRVQVERSMTVNEFALKQAVASLDDNQQSYQERQRELLTTLAQVNTRVETLSDRVEQRFEQWFDEAAGVPDYSGPSPLEGLELKEEELQSEYFTYLQQYCEHEMEDVRGRLTVLKSEEEGVQKRQGEVAAKKQKKLEARQSPAREGQPCDEA